MWLIETGGTLTTLLKKKKKDVKKYNTFICRLSKLCSLLIYLVKYCINNA